MADVIQGKQHRSLTAVASLHEGRDQSPAEDDDAAADKYRADFRRLVVATLWRSVEEAQRRLSSAHDGPWRMDRRTAACLFDGSCGAQRWD